MDKELGYEAGYQCNRKYCQGIIEEHAVENCACHIAPPCSACTSDRTYCPECGWEGVDEEWPQYVPTEYAGLYIREDKPKPLDRTKIDYRILPHSNSSQLCRGVYPEGTTSKEVEKLVKGTFGGRFNRFQNGEFEYVAYTD